MLHILKAILLKKRGLLYFFFCPCVVLMLCGSSFGSQGTADPPDKKNTKIEDMLISVTFKSMGKLFVSAANVEKLKRENSKRIKKMDEAKFRKRYLEIYGAIKKCPALLAEYKFNENLNKEQAIEKIGLLNKKKLYRAIDSIPDSVIADLFKKYLRDKGEELSRSDPVKQIRELWGSIISRSNPKRQ